jgi:hypothetical protein
MMGHRNIRTTKIYVEMVGNDGYTRVAELISTRPARGMLLSGPGQAEVIPLAVFAGRK